MAKEPDFGMDKAKLKAQLAKAKGAAVNCATGKGKDAGSAYILLDHAKAPKALESQLGKDFADLKDPRHGTVTIDEKVDAKLLQFRLNKPSSGLGVRLVKILKTVGYGKVKFEYEDGSPSEAMEEAEENESEGSDDGSTAQAGPDPEALKSRLTQLVQKAATMDTARRAGFLEMAKAAQTLLTGGDAAAAEAKITELGAALDAATAQSGSSDPSASTARGAVAYAKSRLVWVAMRKKMESDLDKLRDALVEFLKEESATDVVDAFKDRIGPVMSALDESLADKLDDASNEADPAKRAKLVDEAKAIIARYQEFVNSEPTLAELDENPFVPMKIQATLTATLGTLASAVR